MSLSDLKHSLRKYEFPVCSSEALLKIEQLLAGRSAPTNKQLDVAMEIISEFVFCESSRRGERRGLNPLQELQLVDVICEYLSACTNDTTKNTVFLSLFGGADTQKRLKILSILASMAMSASSTPVLLAVGVWLQQMGCSSPPSLQLAENIVRDHFHLVTSNQVALKSLTTSAPQFVANFLTAVTELYMCDQKLKTLPPINLLEVITSWVCGQPGLCVAAQASAAALPAGCIPMAAVTPLAGLVRWCTLAPLFLTEPDSEMVEVSPPKKIKTESEISILKTAPSVSLSESALYTKLHLGVLHSLRAARRGAPGVAPAAAALSAQHLLSLRLGLVLYSMTARQANIDLGTDSKWQESTARLGQAVQVAMASGCVYGALGGLLQMLDELALMSCSRLLRIVLAKYR